MSGNREWAAGFEELSTALIADAGLRLGAELAFAPPGASRVGAGGKVAGRVLPARHAGSVDVFLEAIGAAVPGDVLVVDNGGRVDEGCVGDLIALESRGAGLAGMAVWGAHRDTAELLAIGLPVWSYGRAPAGPVRLDPRDREALFSARFGAAVVDSRWIAFADDDGIVFARATDGPALLESAAKIGRRERAQALRVGEGASLREQLRFDEYVRRRAVDPARTFRDHLKEVGGAIEE